MQDFYNECHRLFYYKSGKLYRRVTVCPKAMKDSEAGNIDSTLVKTGNGYRRVKIKGKSYLVHRLVYLMFHGELPECIDHINGDTLDNNIENLRVATKLQNRWNCKPNDGSFTGVKGVFLDGSKFKALITVDKTRYYLGMHETIEDAEKVVSLKYAELQGSFAKKLDKQVITL